MSNNSMTPTERRAVLSLSSIMMLRMIGLFMVLPVLSLYVSHLDAATPLLIGLAMGIYGLSQALFQIPFGTLSDKFGRKPIIAIGLGLFCAGSLLAGFADNIYLMILGRALQGTGAIGSTILAFLADLTSEKQRTKSMAITGMSIGLSFSLAMVLGPLLTQWISPQSLFYLAALSGLIGIGILYQSVPEQTSLQTDSLPEWKAFTLLITDRKLIVLNISVFILHAIFIASFIVIPISLLHFANVTAEKQWHVLLPAFILGFAIALFCITQAEKKHLIKPFFIFGILLIIFSEYLLWTQPAQIFLINIALTCFFAGFSLLEAFLPSLLSRTAPPARKGTAMGIYSCAQFSGIFVGGALGGWLYGQYGFKGIYLFCIILAFIWFSLAFFLKPPSKT